MGSILSVINFLDDTTGWSFMSIRTPARTSFFKAITMLGNPEVVVALAIVICAFLLYKKQKDYLWGFIVGTGAAEGITYVAKIVFHRARPPYGLIIETDYSFPSGHATIAVALYGFILFYIITKLQTSTVIKILAWTIITAVILLIGISRLYLGVHYLSDVLVGYMVGAIGLSLGASIV